MSRSQKKNKIAFLAFISDNCPFFSALTSKISTYVTATCHPAASTIKPAKPFYSQSDLPAASSIIGSSAITGSGSCRLRRLKHPERKICLFPPQTLGVHQTLRVSLQALCNREVRCVGCQFLCYSMKRPQSGI